MGRVLVLSALLAVAGLLVPAAPAAAGDGIYANTLIYVGGRKQARNSKSRRPQTQEEIARYFALYGGFIDPQSNRQSLGGPFDSGFFFDSGTGPNGGDSPYMN